MYGLVEIKVEGQNDPVKVSTNGVEYFGDKEHVVGGDIWCNGQVTPWTKPWKGMKVAFTGKLPGMTRMDAEGEALTVLGAASTPASITKTTNLLILGEKSGAKKAKAEEMGIPTMTANEFVTLVRETKEASASNQENDAGGFHLDEFIDLDEYIKQTAMDSLNAMSSMVGKKQKKSTKHTNKFRICVPNGVTVLEQIPQELFATFTIHGQPHTQKRKATDDSIASVSPTKKAKGIVQD